MITLPGYQVLKQIHASNNSLVYQGYRLQDQQPVMLKLLREDYPTPSQITRYQQEYQLAHTLDLEGVITAYNWEQYHNTFVIVFEDFGGISLQELMAQRQFSLVEFLQVAIKIVQALGTLHEAQIIHKDINPSNLVFNPATGELKIIDLGIATVLTEENPFPHNPNVLEGTLAYISPEQTGRMNRSLDYRTDFYSLGVTFYELLTNQLPFDSTDTLELVYCHLARQPNHLRSWQDQTIPPVVAELVMKLMAKTAESRYQSAWGLVADLQECLRQLKTTSEIADFSLGTKDRFTKLLIPQKLYGRENEVSSLLDAFGRINQSREEDIQSPMELMLVSGFSGIGKSALVKEMYQPITQSRGYFVTGKFDQYQHDIPYSAFIQAFSELIKQLLTETENQLNHWREKITKALGINGQVIIDVIPEVELIIGKQPTPVKLEVKETENRFNLVVQNFIEIFAQPSHPLVIFLDDLQWADLASLKLIKMLLNALNMKSLFLIGAYRDNEVSSTHPLMLTVDELRKTGVNINPIKLSPLDLTDIENLIADTFGFSSQVHDLAKLVAVKTGGNPFFVRKFLQSLYKEKLIYFDFPTDQWIWNLEEIETQKITDNVVELMAAQIKKMSLETQNLLKLAACIGNQFDFHTLHIVSQQSLTSTALSLRKAMQEGLIVPLGDNHKIVDLFATSESAQLISHQQIPNQVNYQFAHDRIQQAAYSLIGEGDKQKVHLQVGKTLWQNTDLYLQPEKIFSIANQLNFSFELIEEQSEKYQLANLNLRAGKKAQAATAYKAAFNYFTTGIQLLSPSSWQTNYDLTLDLYTSAVEAAFLCGNFEQMESLIQIVINSAHKLLDKVPVYLTKIKAALAQNQAQEALKTALGLLKLLGFDLPEQPTPDDIEKILAECRNHWLGKQPMDLVKLPVMENPEKLAAMQILVETTSPCYIAAPQILPFIVCTQMQLSIQYGNCFYSPFSYSCYGATLHVWGDTDSGYEFAKLAIKLLEYFPNRGPKTKTMYIVNSSILHWKVSLAKSIKPLKEAYLIGLETGEFLFAGYCAYVEASHNFALGKQLSYVAKHMATYGKKLKQIKQITALNYLNICHQLVLNLMGDNEDPYQLVGRVYDEKYSLPIHYQANDQGAIAIVYISKLILNYLLTDFATAISNADSAEPYLEGVNAKIFFALYYWYDSLVRLAVYPHVDLEEQENILDRVTANQSNMESWANYAPINYLHKYHLVEAEKARVLKQYSQAVEFYDLAIQGAGESGYLQEEALAYELAAKCYLARERFLVAQTYWKQARYIYFKWGAMAKVKQLDSENIQPPTTITQITDWENVQEDSIGNSDQFTQENLDLLTLIKTSQALSQQKKLSELLEILMKFVLENAGAEKVLFLLAKSEGLVIEAEGNLNESITTLKSIPIQDYGHLSKTIINYVQRTKEVVELGDGTKSESSGIFSNDNYIIEQQVRSVLCLPILSQNQLIAILYLENNLVANAFTEDRLEVLKMICSSAAMAIENSLLRQQEQKLNFEYQVGGCLTTDSPTYVVRQADNDLYRNLKSGQFCYVLNSRHMGKSSLRVRIMERLQAEGILCSAIDLTAIGSQNISVEQWYAGLVYTLVNNFNLSSKFNLRDWWRDLSFLSPVQRLGEFIQQILLKEVQGKIVIFIDEIDSTLGLNFPMDDFFALVRYCYNQRANSPEYKRLSFVLLGVASPSTLIRDKNRTPFNLGQAISLEGFQLHEVEPLMAGLTQKYNHPEKIVKQVLHWTGGQPFLTQKLCNLIASSQIAVTEGKEVEWVDNLVQTKVIDNWESKDDPEHFKTIRNRLLKSEFSATCLLKLYQQICHNGEIDADDSCEQMELLLSGLVSKQQGKLKVYNQIYKKVFNCGWVERNLANISSELVKNYASS